MNFEFSYPDIVKQCNSMAYLNVISFCLLSGCGSTDMPCEQELNRLHKLLEDTDSQKLPKNIAFMSSLYKRCMPVYAIPPENPYDFESFRWIDKKVKRVIEPNVMAYSIINMALLIPLIQQEEIQLESRNFVAYCLKANIVRQVRFLIDYLRLGDFFFSGEDAGDKSGEEYSIVINNENPDIRTQFFVMEALSAAAALIREDDQYSRELLPKIEKCLDTLPVICENVLESINVMSSRDLSVICLSLLAILKYSPDNEIVYNTANSIGFELCERLEHTGDIHRNISDDSYSSFVTLCNCMNCLVRLHEINCISVYEAAYMKLYDRIDSYWDNSCGLFVTSDKSKQKYAFKDTAAILAALRAFRSSLTEPDLFMHVDRQLSSFYSAAILNSKLFNIQFYPILQEARLELHSLGSAEKNTAPVFAEGFEVKPNKRKYYCKPGIFESSEILLGCRYLLY